MTLTKPGSSHAPVVALAAVALALVACDTGGPAAPTTPPVVTAPTQAAVSVEIEPTTARVGEFTTQTYRLRVALDHDLNVSLEVTPPAGDSYEIPHTPLFEAGQTTRVFTSGILTEQSIGDWAMRIMGERLPEDVVLGHPSSVTWSVVP